MIFFDRLMGQGYQGHGLPDSNMQSVQWSESNSVTGGLGQEGERSWLKEWATWGRGERPFQLMMTWFGLLTWKARSAGQMSWSSLLTCDLQGHLQTTVIFGFLRVRIEFLETSSKDPTYTRCSYWINFLEMPWRLSLWSYGACIDYLWLRWVATWYGLGQPRAKLEG